MKQIHIYFIVAQNSHNPLITQPRHPICLLFQSLDDLIIVFWLMGKRTVRAIFYLFSMICHICWIPRTGFQGIHRTVTKQTVKVFQPLMAGKIPARIILKKTMGMFHIFLP